MPLSHAPLSNFQDGNLIVGGAPGAANIVLHTSTFQEFLYLSAVNDRTYELTTNVEIGNSSYEESLVFHIIPDSQEQLLMDGVPLAPGTTVRFSAISNVAVYGHVLRDI